MKRLLPLTLLAALALSPRASLGYEPKAGGPVGTIRGQVRLVGEAPALAALPVYKHADVCGAEVRDERLVVGANGALRNAVVALTDIERGKDIPFDTPINLDNAKCAFVPHVATATAGQKLVIHNSDPFLHDAHAWLGNRTVFNVAVPKGRTVTRSLTDVGLIHINCNVRHTWMRAYIYVSENPYHAVTGEDGTFSLAGVPPGTYNLRVWHELLGSVDRTVQVEAGGTAEVDVGLAATASEKE